MFLGKIAIKSRMTALNTFMPPNRFLHKKKNVNEETFKGKKAEREGEGKCSYYRTVGRSRMFSEWSCLQQWEGVLGRKAKRHSQHPLWHWSALKWSRLAGPTGTEQQEAFRSLYTWLNRLLQGVPVSKPNSMLFEILRTLSLWKVSVVFHPQWSWDAFLVEI